MELQDYIRVVRKRWRIILSVMLLVIALAVTFTLLAPKTYASTTQFFVSTSDGDNVAALQQGNTFTQQRVKSYSQLLQSPKVLDPVIDDLGLDTTADKLASQVTSTIPLDTVIIEVTVTDQSAQQAAAIAQSIDKVFPRTIEQIEQVRTGERSPVKLTVVKPAEVQISPVSPQPVRNLTLGAVLGLLAGFGVALLRDLMDTRVKAQRDVQVVTDKSILGTVPFDPDAAAHPLVVHAEPRARRSEAIRVLRTNLKFVDVANPPKSIVVTSSVPGEGKSTTAANLALSLAETGASVCLVEADLRRPRLFEYLGFEGSVGLTDVLVGRVELDDVMQPFAATSLSILGSGGIPPNPSELLGSTTMEHLLGQLTDRFDYVLLDAPPLLPVTDAAILSTMTDGALVVVGADIVHKAQLRHTVESIEAVKGRILGLILNRLDDRERDGYGTYRYEYTQANGPDRRVEQGRSSGERPELKVG